MWTITNSHVLDASLGYFMSPLFSILLGRLFFNERMTRLQAASIGIAVLGVLWLVFLYGSVPWIALGLTISFGFYSLVRKLAPLAALPGLALETLCMLPIAVLYLLWQGQQGSLFVDLNPLNWGLLIGSGIVTSVPLLLFAAGAKRISMTEMGIIQYISPTAQFVTGLLLFHEAFNTQRFVGYALVWLAVIVYVATSLKKNLHKKSCPRQLFCLGLLEPRAQKLNRSCNSAHSGCTTNDGTHCTTDLLLFVRTFFLFQVQLFRHVRALTTVLV